MKLKNILFIAIAILTIGLFVACNDEVVATKDNNLAYTQVLESNGAFEYNGTKYETLQLALKAIVDGKGTPPDVKTIKVLRDVTGPGASISADKEIVLDLDGHTLTFIDVTDGALSVGQGTTLTVKDGSMGLFDTSNADISVVKADNPEKLSFESVNVNAEGAKTLEATNTTINVKDGSAFTGETSVTGGIFNSEEGTTVAGTFVANGATMNVKNNMTAGISLNNGSSLQVSDSGHAVISSITGEYTIAAANESAITNNTGAAIETVTAVCYIDRVGDDSVSRRTYYGNLLGAFENLEQDNLTIVFFANDSTTYTETLVPAYPVIIDLAGFDVTANITSSYSLNLVSDADGSVITGIITAAEVGLRHVAIGGNVVSNGNMITSSATISGTVDVTGNLTDGEGAGTTEAPYQNGSTFNGQITVAGTATFMDSIISNGEYTVYAKDVLIHKSTVTTTGIENGTVTEDTYTWYKPSDSITIDEGSTITVSRLVGKAVTIEDTSINAAVAQGAVICGKLRIEDNNPITQPSDVVLITDSIGSIYLIDAGTTSTGEYNAVTVSNGSATGILTISTITATGYDVALTGQSADKLIVGVVTSANLIADYTTFNGNITATGAGSFTNSVFTPGSAANRVLKASTVSIKDSTFNPYVAELVSYVFNITADKTDATVETATLAENLKISSSTGTAGSITTTGNTANYKSNIVIDNRALTAAGKHTLSVGAVSSVDSAETPVAFGDVTIKGYFSDVDGTDNDVDSRVTVARIDYAYDVTTSWAVVSGNVSCNTDKHVNTLISENSEFDGTVYAGSVTDGKATPSNDPTPTYTYSDGSTFKGGIQTTGLIELRTSVLRPSASESVEKFVYSESPDVVEEEVKTAAITMRGVKFSHTGEVYAGVWAAKGGSIEMTNSTGTAFKIVATNSGSANNLGTVTIDNSSMSTGTFSVSDTVTAVVGSSPNEYVGDVTIKGHSAVGNLVVDRVYANDIEISYATVNTDVTAKTSPDPTDLGDVTTEYSIFNCTVTASGSITDGAYTGTSTYSKGSTFNGDVSAVGVITLYNSTTTSSVSSTGEGGKVLAYKASLGDNTNTDYINASVVSITDGSKISLLGGIKGCGDAVPAASVTITNPVLYTDLDGTENDVPSKIGSISTGSLSVTAGNDILSVTDATATGATSISGGTFTKTTLLGTTTISDGKFTNGTASVDHSLSGTTTIKGGIFTGAVELSGNNANSITNCWFNDSTAYGSFTYDGTGTLNISGGTFSGTNSFAQGTTTITGGSFGHYNGTSDKAWTSFTGTADVYVENLAIGGLYLGNTSSSGFVTFTKGTVYVNNGANLGYAGSHVAQTAYSDVLTIFVVDDTTLESHVNLSSAVLNLKISVASDKTLWFDASGDSSTNYNMYLASSTGNYTLSGNFAEHNGDSYIYYHQGVNINTSGKTGGVSLVTF